MSLDDDVISKTSLFELFELELARLINSATCH